MTTFFKNALNGTNNIIVCMPISYYVFLMHILLPKAVPLPPARARFSDFPAHRCCKKVPSWEFLGTAIQFYTTINCFHTTKTH